MNPLDGTTFTHKFAFVNGINLHYVDEGANSKQVLVLCHGFPDLWYGWRYQIPFLVKKGYRVIVPDIRGYGQSDMPVVPPADISAYSMKTVTADLAALLDHLNIQKAIFIGHDWGSFIVWRMALMKPDRVKAIASFCAPYTPPLKTYMPIEELAKRFPNWKYQEYFTTQEAEDELNGDTDLFLRILFRTSRPGDVLPEITEFPFTPLYAGKNLTRSVLLTEPEFDYYLQKFANTGFHGGLNYYRTRKVNFEDEKDLPSNIDVPCLMVSAGKDPTLPPSMTKNMSKYIKDLDTKLIEDSAHWILVEQKDRVNEILAEWLEKLKIKGGAKL